LEILLNSPVLVVLITLFASMITGILTWLLGRRRSEAEITKISTEVCRFLVADLTLRVQTQSETIVRQEEKSNRLEEKITGQDEKYERVILYVEKLEDLLIENRIIKHTDLETIKSSLGI
jgi:hypothetical protein